MAVYGLNVRFTGWTATLAPPPFASVPTLPPQQGDVGGVQFNGITQDDGRIANLLNRQSNQAVRMLFISMIGAAPGAIAAKSFKRVTAQTAFDVPGGTNLGGLVPIEVVNYINRANTVTDDSNLTALLNRTHGPAAYPIDASGNGGGGKSGPSGANAYR